MSTDGVIDFFDNRRSYTPPCCRPGGRCVTSQHESPDAQLSEDAEHKLSEFINSGASMRDVIEYWRRLKGESTGAIE